MEQAMRQTTEHRSYREPRVTPLFYAPASASPARSHRPGSVYDSGWQASNFTFRNISRVVVGANIYNTSSVPPAPLVLPPSITVSVDPDDPNMFRVVVMKETFPHLERHVVVRLVRDGQRDANGNESAIPPDKYAWPLDVQSTLVFSYWVSVRWAESTQKQANGSYRSIELTGLTGEGIVGG